MSSEEGDKKNVEEKNENDVSSAEEGNEKEEDTKEEKINNKPAPKKKAADPPKIKQPAKKRVKTEQAEKEKEDKKEEKKKPETEEDEAEDESEDENDTENHKVPLLDQPLEISGSRKRKEVQRFKPIQPEEDSKEFKFPDGQGATLGEIERVDFNIQRAKVEDLKLLHRLCFGKIAKAALLKKNIKKFNGLGFDESSEEFEKKKVQVERNCKKVTVGQIKNLCQILDIERGGTKEELWERVLKFLCCPVDSGKKLPGSGRSKRSGTSTKNYDEGEDSFKSKKKGKSKKKEEESDESDNEDKDQSDEEEDVKNNKSDKPTTTEESEPEKEEEEEKPKKAAKKGKKEAADKKAPPKKRAAAKKVAESEEDDGDNESDNDEEPLVKKVKAPPTDEEIKTYVKSLLEGANLELITMKKVCQDVYAHYPDFDLGHKKNFIKTTVKSLISS